MTQTPKPEERAPYTIEQDDTQGLITPPFWLTGPGIERTFIRDRHTAELVQHFANAAFSAGLEQGKGVVNMLKEAEKAIASLPINALGMAEGRSSAGTYPYPIRDALLNDIGLALLEYAALSTQQPTPER